MVHCTLAKVITGHHNTRQKRSIHLWSRQAPPASPRPQSTSSHTTHVGEQASLEPLRHSIATQGRQRSAAAATGVPLPKQEGRLCRGGELGGECEGVGRAGRSQMRVQVGDRALRACRAVVVRGPQGQGTGTRGVCRSTQHAGCVRHMHSSEHVQHAIAQPAAAAVSLPPLLPLALSSPEAPASGPPPPRPSPRR